MESAQDRIQWRTLILDVKPEDRQY